MKINNRIVEKILLFCMLLVLYFISALNQFSCSHDDNDPANTPTPTPMVTMTPTPTVITFILTYGGELSDYANHVTSIDDGYVFCGNTKSFGENVMNIYLVKTDKLGEEVWFRTFGGPNWAYGNCVQQSNDSGFVVTGKMLGKSVLIKVDNSGNNEWIKLFHEGVGYSVQQTNDNGYIITGESYYDVILIKTDEFGEVEWLKTFGVPYSKDTGYAVLQTTDGGYVVCGQWNYHSPAGEGEIFLLKTNAEGDELWFSILVPGGYHCGWDVKQTIDSGYVVVGTQSSKGVLLKAGPDGQLLWRKIYDLGHQSTMSVQVLEDEGFIIAGSGEYSEYNKHYASILKTDNMGNEIWHQFHAIGRDTYCTCIDTTSDKGFILCGGSNDIIGDAFLLKTNNLGLF